MRHGRCGVLCALLLSCSVPSWCQEGALFDPILVQAPVLSQTQVLPGRASLKRTPSLDRAVPAALPVPGLKQDAGAAFAGWLQLELASLPSNTDSGAYFERAEAPAGQAVTIEGREYELVAVSQHVDPKYAARVVGMRIRNVPEGFARFSVAADGRIAGTIQTPDRAYRILPSAGSMQAVFRLTGARNRLPARSRLISKRDQAAFSLERRHAQLELLADAQPEKAISSVSGGALTLIGGDLGQLPRDGDVSSRDIQQVLRPFVEVEFLPGGADLRVTRVLARPNGKQIEFEQTINGVPVWGRNLLRVNREAKVLEIRATFVDSGRTPLGGLISQSDAIRRAVDAVERAVGPDAAEYELVGTPGLHYYSLVERDELTAQYRINFSAEAHGSQVVVVNAHTGEATVFDSSIPADVFAYNVCRDNSPTQHPNTCSSPGADIVWSNPIGGNAMCPYSNPMGGLPTLCTGLDGGQAQSALLNANRALTDIHQANPDYCCDLIGGTDRNLDLVYKTTGTSQSGAHYDLVTESIMSPTDSSQLRSVEAVWHELGHHILHKYNPTVMALYGQNPPEVFARAFIESYADLMAEGIGALHPSSDGTFLWRHGDSQYHIGAPRDLNDPQLTFAHIGVHNNDPHEGGRAISRLFAQIKETSGISARRFTELLLEVGDRLQDFDGNGLDLIDLRNTLHLSIRANETALHNVVTSRFDALYTQGAGAGPTPPAAPLPPGMPSPPVVQAIFRECATTPGGQPSTRWWIRWNAVPGATHYVGWLKNARAYFFSDVQPTSGTELTAGIFGTGNSAWAGVQACNASGCSYISNQVLVEMLPICFH